MSHARVSAPVCIAILLSLGCSEDLTTPADYSSTMTGTTSSTAAGSGDDSTTTPGSSSTGSVGGTSAAESSGGSTSGGNSGGTGGDDTGSVTGSSSSAAGNGSGGSTGSAAAGGSSGLEGVGGSAGADAGTDSSGGGGRFGEEIPDGYVPGIIAVGYGGLRVVSRDDGQTWTDAVDFGSANADDENLLRAVTYGKGRWIATGWRLIYSDDGVDWVDYSMVRDEFGDQSIIEGLAYNDGYFYAAGDPGKFYRSKDGLEWESYGATIGNTQKHTALAYRGGKFVAYGDNSTSFESRDGLSWSELGVSKGTYCEGEWRSLTDCHDAAWFEPGFYLHAEWGGDIRRSVTGSNFQTVYNDPEEHTAYKSFTFASGFVRP